MKWKFIKQKRCLVIVLTVFWLIYVTVPYEEIQNIAKPFALASAEYLMLELFTSMILSSIKKRKKSLAVRILTFCSDISAALIWIIAALVGLWAVMQIFGHGLVS